MLQGSVREGRRGLQAESSRTFSSVTDSRLLHKTCRVRRPLLQLRLHSDHSPVHQLQEEHINTRTNQQGGGGAGDILLLLLQREDKSAGTESEFLASHLGEHGSVLHDLLLSLGLFFLSQN